MVLRDMKDPSSVTVSFRTDSALKDGLAAEAEKRHLSLNAYVGECLQRSLEWVTLQQQLEYVSLSKEILQTLLDKIENREIAKLARKLHAPRLKDLANLTHGKADLDGLLQVLKLTAKYQYPLPVICALREDSEGSQIFLQHGISQKWSVFLGEGCLAYLESIGLKGSYEVTPNSIKLTTPGRGCGAHTRQNEI